MKEARDFEKNMGIHYYITDTQPLFGIIKYKPEDFIVEEILRDGTILNIDGNFKLNFPDKGNFLYIVTLKRNLNIYELINSLVNNLRISHSYLGVSGVKDKRAVTTQLVSIKGYKKELIEQVKFKKIKILASAYSYGPLRLGTHLGNRFTVTIRKINLDKDTIYNISSEVTNTLNNIMIPNYFGYQRFGIPRPFTHEIGKALVLNDYEKAVRFLIGNPDPLEPEENKIARKIYDETNDPAETLKYLPSNLYYERIVLEYLLHHPNEYANALAKLPSSILRLFLESYSSYLFNKFLSERINSIGFNLNEGDLVSPLDNLSPINYVFEIGRNISKERALWLLEKSKVAIVLPVIGHRVKLNGGYMRDIENKILIEEGVRIYDFKVKLTDEKTVALKGAYRRIDLKLIHPIEFQIISDEIFNAHSLLLRFSLPRGCYATIILREFMKSPTPASYIGKANGYF
jgi:tRNA pseudouridine13 synthase